MLTVPYLAITLALFVGWRRWRAAALAIRLDPHQLRWCIWAYWTVAATFLASALACLAAGNYEGTRADRAVALTFAIGTVPQAALFAFVLVPIAFRSRRYRAWSFPKKLAVAQCILLPLACAGLLLHLWAFFRLEALMKTPP